MVQRHQLREPHALRAASRDIEKPLVAGSLVDRQSHVVRCGLPLADEPVFPHPADSRGAHFHYRRARQQRFVGGGDPQVFRPRETPALTLRPFGRPRRLVESPCVSGR